MTFPGKKLCQIDFRRVKSALTRWEEGRHGTVFFNHRGKITSAIIICGCANGPDAVQIRLTIRPVRRRLFRVRRGVYGVSSRRE